MRDMTDFRTQWRLKSSPDFYFLIGHFIDGSHDLDIHPRVHIYVLSIGSLYLMPLAFIRWKHSS